MKGWDVFICGVHLDTVFFSEDCDAEYVRRSLIDHDNYAEEIEVVEQGEHYEKQEPKRNLPRSLIGGRVLGNEL